MTNPSKLFWGDIHNHNEIGYGKGTLERSYRIAKGARLDVYAFTPHGHWRDAPKYDMKLTEYHRLGYETVQARWREVMAAADAEYQPGRFVSFPAFETHSSRFGDYHILLKHTLPDPFDPEDIHVLQAFCRQHDAVMIPHHIAYKAGWRGANYKELDTELSPVLCVFSEHGDGMQAESPWPYARHSNGGSERSQTAMAQLKKGLIAGVIASTDDHDGHPAAYGEGLAAFWADELTRDGILDAIRKRHTYAVSGERIALDVRMAGGMMGDVLSANTPRTVSFSVEATAAIDSVRIIKNGETVHCRMPQTATAADPDYYIARLEFGWDALNSMETTEWDIHAAVSGGEILDAIPYFCGGGSETLINAVTAVTNREVSLTSFTSRENIHPTNHLALKIAGKPDTRLAVRLSAKHRGKVFEIERDARISEMLDKDVFARISTVFSAPKIRIGQVRRQSEVSLTGEWTDPNPGRSDFYLVYALLKNGHLAYSSPIWCRD